MIRVEVKSTGVDEALLVLMRKLSNPAPMLQGIGNELNSQADKAFQNKVSPDGNVWAPMSATTQIMRALKKSGGTMHTKTGKVSAGYQRNLARAGESSSLMYDTGSLVGSLHSVVSGNSVTVGVSPQHNSGGKSALALFFGTNRAGRGNKVKIPARPWWPVTSSGQLSEQGTKSVLSVVRDHLNIE